MSVNYTRDPNSIKMLMNKLVDKHLYLPEFQRDFTWNIERSVDLFDSIARGIFIGALIESKPKFPLSCREIDHRPRKGRGSRAKLKEFNFKASDFDNNDHYVLLDGQQRVTSLYRALHGIDDIYFILKDPIELPSAVTEQPDITEVIDGFSFKKIDNKLCFTVNEIFKNPASKEKVLREGIFNSEWETVKDSPDYLGLEEEYFDCLLTIRHEFNKILDDKTLLSVFLLDMDLEKFCLFFERSNSKGVNLNFTDIITAKVYVGFKLGKEVEKLSEDYNIPINSSIVESIIRYISFLEAEKVDKKTILTELEAAHFNKHWELIAKLFDKVHSYLLSDGLVINFSWLNYKTMLIPMAHFLRKLPHQEFSQMSQDQLKYFNFWFYSSLINMRYGGGMAGSTNNVIVEDCKLLESLAINGVITKNELKKFKIKIDKEELINLTSKGASFNGVMSLLNHKNRFKNWSNTGLVNTSEKIDVHHIFPKKFVSDQFGEESYESENVDSILNKAVIEKLPNQKYGAKAPSIYLNETPLSENEKMEECLDTHLIPNYKNLLDGSYNADYKQFINDRFDLIYACLKSELLDFQEEILKED